MRKWFIWIIVAALGASSPAAEKKGRSLDANGDGTVTKEEFMASIEKRFKAQDKEFDAAKVATAFSRKDKNKDGVLTGDELPSAAKGK